MSYASEIKSRVIDNWVSGYTAKKGKFKFRQTFQSFGLNQHYLRVAEYRNRWQTRHVWCIKAFNDGSLLWRPEVYGRTLNRPTRRSIENNQPHILSGI